MELPNLDESLDRFYRSLDNSVSNLLHNADDILNDISGSAKIPDRPDTNNQNQSDKKPLESLVRDERLEEETKSRIGTFEKIYSEVFDPCAKDMRWGYADLNYSALVTLLSSSLEIELNESVYRVIQKNNPPSTVIPFGKSEIKLKCKTQTLGCFSFLIKRFNKDIQPYIHNTESFTQSLSAITEKRNDAAHTTGVTEEQFRFFYQKFSKLFNENIGTLMDMKMDVRASSPTSFSKSSKPVFDLEELKYLERISNLQNIRQNDTGKDTSQPTLLDNAPVQNALRNEKDKYGIIFTDCSQLATKYFGDDRIRHQNQIIDHAEYIRSRLAEYAAVCLNYGIHYTILDVSRFDPFMDKSQGWRGYLNLLDKYCDQQHIPVNEDTWGLFIIGGGDVIPMPSVRNPSYTLTDEDERVNKSDKTVDTDLPYSYRGNQIALDANLDIDLNKLLACNPRFLVGRLPLENGFIESDFEKEITSYFVRSIEAYKNGGIEIKTLPLLTSCETSKEVAKYMVKDLPLMKIEPVMGYVENNIIISPPYAITDIDSSAEARFCLDMQLSADMLMFILHGSEQPMMAEYFGERNKYGDIESAIGFHSNTFFHCKAKCVAGICCFGARFIGYKRTDSALLKAIYSNTLLFMGASRTAYGYFDCHLQNKEIVFPIYASEVLIRYYAASLLSGTDAGKALMEAKMKYLDFTHRSNGSEVSIRIKTTLLEFNLFGDPFLKVIPVMKDSHVPDVKRNSMVHNFSYSHANDFSSIISSNGLKIKASVECLSEKRSYSTMYCKKSSLRSLSSKVRELVDRNFKEIHDIFTQKLYDELGIPPRELYSMQRYSSSTGKEGYSLTYRHETDYLQRDTIVELDLQGNITSVAGTF